MREKHRMRSGTDSSGDSSPYSTGDSGSSSNNSRGRGSGGNSPNGKEDIMFLLNNVQKIATAALRSTDSVDDLHSSSSGSHVTLKSLDRSRDRDSELSEDSPRPNRDRKNNPLSYGVIPLTSTYLSFVSKPDGEFILFCHFIPSFSVSLSLSPPLSLSPFFPTLLYISICLSSSLSRFLSLYLFVCLLFSLSTSPSVSFFVSPSISLSLSFTPSEPSSSLFLSVCLFLSLSLSL